MDDEADKNRTFEEFSAVMWPTFQRNQNFSRGDAYYKTNDAYFEAKRLDDYARAAGAFYVYQRVGHEFNRVRVKYWKGQALIPYLTKWELMHSTLSPGSNRSVEPFVDENYTLVGHYGWFWENQILIPKGLLLDNKKKALAWHIGEGTPAFADTLNRMPSFYGFYGTIDTGTPASKYLVLTDPEGKVIRVCARETGDDTVSTTPPWEYVVMGRALVGLGRVGIRKLIRILMRKGTEELLANGPTIRAAEKALEEAEKRAAKAEAKGAGDTLRGVGAYTARTAFRRRAGRMTVDEMEQYLNEVMANHAELRLLTSARGTNGQQLVNASNNALRAWEKRTGNRVVPKTAREMQAVTGPENYMTHQGRELWVNSEAPALRDPATYYENVAHELCAHALTGRGGSLGPDVLPFVTRTYARHTNGVFILEEAIRQGDVARALRLWR